MRRLYMATVKGVGKKISKDETNGKEDRKIPCMKIQGGLPPAADAHSNGILLYRACLPMGALGSYLGLHVFGASRFTSCSTNKILNNSKIALTIKRRDPKE